MRFPIVCLLTLIAISTGCRKDSAPAAAMPEAAHAKPQAAHEVTLRIRKLGGEDGKHVLNQIAVRTPVGDEFMVTEQLGTTQLELRGKVVDLKDGMYRVAYEYHETSGEGRTQLKSLIEMRANTEEELGAVVGAETSERLFLRLSRS